MYPRIIRQNATKQTLKFEIRDIKEELHDYDLLIRKSERDISKYNTAKKKLNVRLAEMEERYKNK